MENITKFLEFKNYYKNNSGLINNPKPLNFQKPTFCIFYKEFKTEIPIFSIVIPIHNQEKIINKNINSIIKNTQGTFELILILDACIDKTEEKLLTLLNSLNTSTMPLNENIINVTVIKSTVDMFETVCDNIGFRLSKGVYIIEIQADMEMTQNGYNLILLKPFIKYKNTFAVSGRCCWSVNNNNKNIFYNFKGRCRFRLDNDKYDRKIYSDKKFYVNHIINRGPLLIDNQKLKKLGYLDETNFFLGYDDIDIMIRAFDLYGWICGFVPIDFKANVNDGSTRKRTLTDKKIYNLYRKNKLSSRGGYWLIKRKKFCTPVTLNI